MNGKKKKALRWIILLLIVLVIAGWLLLRPNAETAYSKTQVTTGDVRTTYSFTGSIVAPRSQTAVSGTSGKVKEVYVEANQMVDEGDRLVKLSSGETIRAEIDGEVAQLNVREDDMVAAGSVLAVIMDTALLEGEVLVDEYDVDAIELGKEVRVTVNALGETCAGTVKSFDKQSTIKGNMAAYTAHIEMDVPEKALPGMQIEAIMLKESAEDVLVLDVDALQFDSENKAYVLTKNADGALNATYVETGVNDGTRIEIVSGLQSGQTVYYAASIDIMELMMAMRGGR